MRPRSTMKAHYRIDELAELLNVSERTVKRWLAEGVLVSIRIAHTRRIPVEEVNRVTNWHQLTQKVFPPF